MSRATELQLREPLALFVQLQEATLKANDHKGGWQEMSLYELVGRCRQEFFELEEALAKFRRDEGNVDALLKLHREAADVANFAMMIADNADRDHRKALERAR